MRVNNILLSNAKRSGFLTRIEVVSRQSAEQLDYQVQVTNIPARRGNGEDVRFFQKNQILNHWKESYASWLSAAWTKLPRLLITKSQILFALSGNSSAPSASNGTNTLEYSDDFNRADGSPGSNWTIYSGTWNIESGELSGSGSADTNDYIRSSYTGTNYAVRSRLKHLGGGTYQSTELTFRFVDTNNHYHAGYYGTNKITLFKRVGGTWTLLAQTVITSDSNFHIMEVKVAGQYARVDLDNVEKIGNTNLGTDFSSGYAGCYVEYSAPHGHYDWFLTRKYASPEPLSVKRKICNKAGILKAICGGIAG